MTRFQPFCFITTALLTAGCGSSGGGGTGGGASSGLEPAITSTSPHDGATAVPRNTSASVTFSEAMDCASITDKTFTLSSAGASIPGTVVCAGATAAFWPAAHLASNTAFTATLMKGAKSLGGVALAANHAWSFTTGAVMGPGATVDLGGAGAFAILAKSAISSVPKSTITGDLGLSPAAATFITGFSLTADATNVFSTSSQVTGKVYAASYAVPTPSNLTTAVHDMERAFVDAAGRAPDVTELGAGSIGGMTLAPGVYKWGTGLLIATDVTLAGDANAVWIFEIAQSLTMSSGARVSLSGGARPKNVFWQVGSLADIGTTAHLEGVVLTQTAITLRTGASVNGRLLSQTAVTLDSNTIVQAAP